jgi:hypothetical protein
MNWISLIKPELLILMPVLYIVGNIVKSSPAKNWMIPFILWGISVLLTVAYIFATEAIDAIHFFIGFVQGTFLTFATVGTNEVIKQAAISKAVVANKDNAGDKTAADEPVDNPVVKPAVDESVKPAADKAEQEKQTKRQKRS